MYIPKRYGESRIDQCPFCGKNAFVRNDQRIPVCKDHAKTELPPLTCVCGQPIDLLEGKFGMFGSCLRCGNMALKKLLEVNEEAIKNPAAKPAYKIQKPSAQAHSEHKIADKKPVQKTTYTEQTIRSDDERYFD